MAWYDSVSAIGDVAANALKFGYSLFTNKRDFDYQKNLQQQVFEREDTAVKRRMEDLKNAGLNPNLAAGSAASSGSVVGRSNTPGLAPGSALDALSALNQVKMQREQLKTQQAETKYWNAHASNEEANDFLNTAYLYAALGLNPEVQFTPNGEKPFTFYIDGDRKSDYAINKLLEYQLSAQKNSADMLQKENNWFLANELVGMGTDVLGLFKPKLNGYKK